MLVNDFNDPLDNTQQTSTSTNQQQNLYQPQTQQRVNNNYISQTRPQLSSYQTPNLQRIPTMPTSTIIRPANVISNGIQQQSTIYTPQQMMNPSRPVYPRMPTSQQNMPSTLVRQQYNTPGMVPMNQNVTQMSIVKASDPNNNSVFVTNPQQQPTLVGLQSQHTVTQTAQTNKPVSTGLPSLTQQQLNQFNVQPSQIYMQQQNPLQSYNIRASMMDQTSTNPPNYIITTQSQQVQQTLPNGLPSNQLNVSSSTNNSQQHTEAQRKQFIQKQLVLLLHAHKCQQREKQTINGETTRPSTCTLPHCSTMKNVLQHMTKCNDPKTCTVPHCVTSRQIILHWKQCNNSQCPICQPLKTPSTLAKLNQTTNNNNNTNPTAPPTTTTTTTTTSTTINKEWQRRVTQEMRNHLVQKIITALIPITDTGAMRDKRIINLANYARRVESETFEIANNQEEYFHKLAEKIYKIQKELEDRREKKRLQDMQLSAQISSQALSTNDFNGKIHSTMDTMAGDHGPPNRTAPLTDYSSSAAGNLLQQQTIKSEPLMTLTNRTMVNNNNNNLTSGTFTITNIPSNENLNFLLNGVITTTGQQSHDIDMMDTTRNSMDGTNQFKNEPFSPKNVYQVCCLD
jgi:E1A/CREB-binding protein